MPTERVRMSVEVEGLNEALRAFRTYGKEASAELRDAAQEHANRLVPTLVAAMVADSAQSRLVATTVRSVRDRVPTIAVGGAKRVTPTSGPRRKRKPQAGDIFFGAEFGGGSKPSTRQFRPHKGTEGYAFYPTLRRHTDDLIRAYMGTLDRLADEWEHRG